MHCLVLLMFIIIHLGQLADDGLHGRIIALALCLVTCKGSLRDSVLDVDIRLTRQ